MYSTWINKSFQLLNSSPNFKALGDVITKLCFKLWKTVSKVPDTKDTVKFKLDSQEITYTIDMFRDTLYLPVETPDNPFIAPVNIKVIVSFTQKVGYQGVVDKDFINCIFHKKDVIQYPRFTKLIIADLMKKECVVSRDAIPNAFLTDEICAIDDYVEYEMVFLKVVEGEKDEESYASKFAASMLHDDVDDSDSFWIWRTGLESSWFLVKRRHKYIVSSLMDTAYRMSEQFLHISSFSSKMRAFLLILNVEALRIYDQGHGKKMDDDFHSQHHDDHQEDDAPPEGEKRVKRHKTSKVQFIDENEVIPKDETLELITEFQNVNKRIPTIFDCARMEAALNDMLSNQFRNAEEYAYHLEQVTHFIENQIV
nr:hypothetical protein [Tanacetum cinerariifolium]